MTEKIVGFTLSDAEIKKLHLPVPNYVNTLNTTCLCPVCRPTREPVK